MTSDGRQFCRSGRWPGDSSAAEVQSGLRSRRADGGELRESKVFGLKLEDSSLVLALLEQSCEH